WRWAFAVAGIAAAVALLIALIELHPAKPERREDPRPLLDFRPVFRNRRAMGFILAYAVHTWELTALRSWTVAFLVFSASLTGAGPGWFRPVTAATLSAVVAWAASVAGGELASRFERRRTIGWMMASSAVVCAGLGASGSLPYAAVAVLLLVYAGFVQA